MSEFEQTPEKETIDQRQRLRRYINRYITEEVPSPDMLAAFDIPVSSGGTIAHGIHYIDEGRLMVVELIDISDCFTQGDTLVDPEYQLRLGIHDAADGHCQNELTIDELNLFGESARPIATYLQDGVYYDYAENNKLRYFDTVVESFFEQFDGIIPPEKP